MSVYKRPDSRYYQFEFVFKGHRYRGSTKLHNKTAAQRYECVLIERLAKQRGGIADPEPAPFFYLFAAQIIESEKQLRSTTLRNYHVQLRNLEPFHKLRLDEITAKGIGEFITKRLSDGRKAATVNRDLAFLRKCLQLAVARDLIPTTPFLQRKVRLMRESRREHIITFAEERKYLAVADEPLRSIAVLMVELGLRPKEACGIRREDIHPHAMPPFLNVPGGKSDNAKRDVPLTKKAQETLAARSASAKGPHLFPLRRRNNTFDWTRPMNELHKAHYDALELCGLDFRIYDLRHTYGTRAIEAGEDPLTLMKLMGHASLSTTQRYVHLSKRHLGAAQKRIETHRAEREIAEVELERGEETSVQ
jgi:integrase